jgi:hypothetical protein
MYILQWDCYSLTFEGAVELGVIVSSFRLIKNNFEINEFGTKKPHNVKIAFTFAHFKHFPQTIYVKFVQLGFI